MDLLKSAISAFNPVKEKKEDYQPKNPFENVTVYENKNLWYGIVFL